MSSTSLRLDLLLLHFYLLLNHSKQRIIPPLRPVQRPTLEETVEAKDGEHWNIFLDALINIVGGYPVVVQAAEETPVFLDLAFRSLVAYFNYKVSIYREPK